MDDYEVVAEELSKLAEKWREPSSAWPRSKRVNARLEEAALTTARGLGEVSASLGRGDAMRRADRIDKQISSSATTMRLRRVAASHRIRGHRAGAPGRRGRRIAFSPRFREVDRALVRRTGEAPSFRRCTHSESRQVRA